MNGQRQVKLGRANSGERRCRGIITAMVILLLAWQVVPVLAEGLEVQTALELVLRGEGQVAVQRLAQDAAARGGWGPAPGDVVVYDPAMAWNIRGAVVAVDDLPADCANPQLSRHLAECEGNLSPEQEPLVRFGQATFSTRQADGTWAARAHFDDILAVYVEEVGHSWQEYQYETEGRGRGPRTLRTSWEAGQMWSAGREYQVKHYVLSLDGTWLDLSAQERAEFRSAICAPDGYANPLNHRVPAYSAPPGWPNPSGWPTENPAPEALAAFCS